MNLILAFTLVSINKYSNGFPSEPTFNDASIKPSDDGSIRIEDMILDEFQFNKVNGADTEVEPGDGVMFSGISGERYRWPNAELPYVLSNQLNTQERNDVEAAITDFNQKLSGCIEIRKANNQDRNWVNVIKDGGCYSWIGRHQNGGQSLSLSYGCYSKRTIQHEFIHALGFYHEHTRPDRNKYVTINWNNIDNANSGQFVRQKTSLTFEVPYDGKSVMHYAPGAFSRNSYYTIESKMNNIPTSQLGSSSDLTEYDILKLKRMYKCKTTDDDDTNDKGPCANLFLESTILTKSYKRNGINSNIWIDPTDSKNAIYKDENLNWCITETYSEDFTCKFYSSSATKTPDLAKDWNYYNDDGDLETVTPGLNFRLSCQGSGGFISGPDDFDGICPYESYLYIATVGDKFPGKKSCCCGKQCCWDKCKWSEPPMNCLPTDDTEWVYNESLGYYQAKRGGIANVCLTKSGPSSNQPCIFPFTWNSKTYNGCPIDPDDSSQRWCSTKVDSNGNHISGQGNWGHCGSKCPEQN